MQRNSHRRTESGVGKRARGRGGGLTGAFETGSVDGGVEWHGSVATCTGQAKER
jgi:hypothetical protein